METHRLPIAPSAANGRGHRWHSTALCAAAWLSLVTCGLCAEPDFTKLFELAAGSTPTAIAAVKQEYEGLSRAFPSDQRVDYAYGLALGRQHRYRDALPLVSRYWEANRTDTDALEARIWLEMQDKKFAPALSDSVLLARQITKQPGSTPAGLAAAQFLGTMFGFHEVNVPEEKDTANRKTRRQEVLAALGTTYLASFDEGRQNVLDRLDSLQDGRAARQTQTEETIKKQSDADRLQADKNRQRAAVEQNNVQLSAEQLKDAERAYRVVQQQLASLAADRTRLAAQIVIAQAQLEQCLNPPAIDRRNTIIPDNNVPRGGGQGWITINNPLAPNQPQFVDRATNTRMNPNDPRFLQAQLLAINLGTLNQQAFDMDRKVATLQAQGAELVARGQQEAEELEASAEIVESAQNRADVLEKKALNAQAKAPPRTSALNSQMRALSTYMAFPFDEESQRVLGWFRQ